MKRKKKFKKWAVLLLLAFPIGLLFDYRMWYVLATNITTIITIVAVLIAVVFGISIAASIIGGFAVCLALRLFDDM